MKADTLRYLRTLAHGPRTLRSFSHGDMAVHANAVVHHMNLLQDEGYAERIGSGNDAGFAITALGENYLCNQPEIAPSRVICNASSTLPYVPAKWGRETVRHPSRGMGA